jgi:hypothetical protein
MEKKNLRRETNMAMDDSKIDEMIAEVSREWATGKWSSIVISIGERGNPSMGFVGGASSRDNGLKNGKARKALKKAIRKGYIPIGIIAVKDGKQHLLPLSGTGFTVGIDPESGERCFERRTGEPSQNN